MNLVQKEKSRYATYTKKPASSATPLLRVNRTPVAKKLSNGHASTGSGALPPRTSTPNSTVNRPYRKPEGKGSGYGMSRKKEEKSSQIISQRGRTYQGRSQEGGPVALGAEPHLIQSSQPVWSRREEPNLSESSLAGGL